MIYNSVLITGANRGIGLHFVKELLKMGNNQIGQIIATYRDPNKLTELNELAKSNQHLSLVQLDAKDYSTHGEFAKKIESIVGDKGLSLLINNAGIAKMSNLETVTPEDMVNVFEVNTVAPLMLSRALLPALKQSSANGNRTVIANISSQIGSIEDNKIGGYYAYRASKTALNQVTKSLSVDLGKDKIEATALHPGWVQTDMGGEKAPMKPEKSVNYMIKVLTEKKDLNGKFVGYNGNTLPW